MTAKPLYDWDESKRAANIHDHRVDFAAASEFNWDNAVVFIDERADYGELRKVAIGFVGVRLHVLVFTRRGDRIMIISIWKAQKSDVKRYVEGIG